MAVVFFFLRLSLELSANHWDIKDSLRQRTSTHTLTHTHTNTHPVGHKVAGVTATVTEVNPRVPLETKPSLIERSLWHQHRLSFHYQLTYLIKTGISL